MKPNRASTIVAELLEEQQLLTAVSRFSQKHEAAEIPLQSRYYRDLIPLERPQAGEQYAFEVDLDKCSGCKACVAACHSLNGLEDDESWRSVGLLVNEKEGPAFQQTVTTACHHCVDPACLNGCPVLAYEKNPVTGIVHHLDDQCIGCQYCVLKCPYEVPRYSARLGIVRKCDMCSNRLEAGEAPACVQSCPSEAIRITKVRSESVRARFETAEENRLLPASPDPSYTLPTTIYRSARALPETLTAADARQVQPADPHWPLVFMLTLTQASAGLFWMRSLLCMGGGGWPQNDRWLLMIATVLGFAGLGASILHLGRPLQAWRAFIGVGRSWLSREIVMFGAFASSVLLLLVLEALPQFFPAGVVESNVPWHFASLTAALAVACSIMVYHDTPREFWNWKRTAPQFVGSALVSGACAGLFCVPNERGLLILLCFSAMVKLALFLGLIIPVTQEEFTPLKRSAILLTNHLGKITLARLSVLALAGVLAPIPFLMSGEPVPQWASAAMFLLLLGGELAERFLFFRAVSQPKMPGGLP